MANDPHNTRKFIIEKPAPPPGTKETPVETAAAATTPLTPAMIEAALAPAVKPFVRRGSGGGGSGGGGSFGQQNGRQNGHAATSSAVVEAVAAAPAPVENANASVEPESVEIPPTPPAYADDPEMWRMLNEPVVVGGESTSRAPKEVQREMPAPAEVPECVTDPEVGIPEDLILAYGEYANGTEMPREAHETVFVNILASMLNAQGNTFNVGSVDYSMDMWTLMLSASGTGRSTIVALAMKLLDETGVRLSHSGDWGSRQALYQSYATQPWGLTIKGEFRELTERLKNPQFAEAKVWLTDRFDNMRAPDPITYRETGKAEDTPTIEFAVAPRVNLLCTSSVAWFNANLEKGDTTGGFMARWLIEMIPSGSLVPIPPHRDPEMAKPLIKGLARVAGIRNQCWVLTAGQGEIAALYDQWYRETAVRFARHSNMDLTHPFWNRMKGYILKLALVYEVATTGRFEITRRSFLRAAERMLVIETNLFKLLKDSGMTSLGAEEGEILEFVVSRGATGVKQSDLGQRFKSIGRGNRKTHYLNLLESERLVLFSCTGKGRTGYWFVGRQFAAAHAKATGNELFSAELAVETIGKLK